MLENGQENLYIDSYSHLSEINGINFTRREVDIISCILSGRGAKKTASLLEISPKTADAHIRNIMLKLGCNSRERIIDFFERSGKQHYAKQHYVNLHNDASLVPDLDNQQATTTNTPLEILENKPDTREGQNQYWKTVVTSLTIGVFCLCFWTFRPMIYSKETTTYSIKSDLPIPNDEVLLERSRLIKDINSKLISNYDGIQTVALMGVGGAGKTTLARHYARNQRLPIVWEINAETKESLLRSFEVLAYALARTQKERDEVRSIQRIMNVHERESQLLHFMKVRLKSSPNWLLIYDNVDSFADIHHYFPHDPSVWGNGKVIITTRDSNIKTNSHIRNNKVIPIRQLSPAELENLFTKIMKIEGNVKLAKSTVEQRRKFLAGLPPFPLDVATAAYCLRETKLSQTE